MSGAVTTLPAEVAEAYFSRRPRQSQLSAAASQQSQVVLGRQQLEQQLAVLQSQLKQNRVPRPEAWIGYRLRPTTFEFWQGRPDRLHDRFRYQIQGEAWQIERLSP